MKTLAGREVVREPEYMRNVMNFYRKGLIPVPDAYVTYHVLQAKKELELLQAQYGFEILRKRMVNSGWFDGMRETEVIIETKAGKLLRLRYNDGTCEFFRGLDIGGSIKLYGPELE
jgi:hypothetical protein